MDALCLSAHTDPRRATATKAVLSTLFLLFWTPEQSLAQPLVDNSWFVRTGAASGFILPGNPYTADPNYPGDPIRWGRNLTIEIGRQTDGHQEWHQLYGIPSYGFGFSLASFGNQVQRASPMEAYTFFSWPFARLTERMDLTTDFGMGLSWHWKEIDNHSAEWRETSLGSDLNARINWGFYLRYVTTPQFTLYTGVDYTHRSNGGLAQPDRGINVIGPKVALQYFLKPTETRYPRVARPPFHPSWEFVVGGMGGAKNVIERNEPLARHDYWTVASTAALQFQFYRFGKIAIGTDLAYDGATGATIDDDDERWRAAAGERWALGAYGGYEHVVGRFSAIVQIGQNVASGFDGINAPPQWYERFGWRYHFNDRYWTTIVIRAIEGRRADALQFGVGYRLPFSGNRRVSGK